MVKSAEKTLFGLQHNFSEIKSVEDFQKCKNLRLRRL